ncbi:MAG TPA: YdeI/OmpD-associated family protein [Bacteroidia bacterium]|nr:YdeI/OmpD-associated family protein [Bacteroidia bacterium]HNP97918.1 YdeI/OmpD-associated family protein [Bacteroidia bacterium]
MSISTKLKIKEGDSIFSIHAPENFESTLGSLPKGASISSSAKGATQLHWFVKNKAQLEKELEKTLKLLKERMTLWIYYPKSTSGVQTDLTRDKGWDSLLAHKELHWLSLISFDDTWSAFACRIAVESDIKKAGKTIEKPILDYIDPVKKIVTIPDDLAKALKKNKRLDTLFHSLAYSHKKEYVEWIVTAKKEETRASRIEGTIERLEKGWKNPRNQ